MNKILKYILLVFGWFIAGIILLIVIAGLVLQTRPVKKKIATIAENKTSEILNGQISLGEIDGNFFTSLTLKNVLWTQENDTLAFIKEFDAGFDLLPLLNGELLVHNAKILEPRFYLKQENDSTWNVQNLIEPQEKQPKDTSETSSNFRLDIANFEIIEGQVKIETPDTVIPQQVNHLNTKLALFYSSEEQRLDLDSLSLATLNPSLILEKLSFKVKRNTEEIQLQNLYVKTAQNKLVGNVEYIEDTLLNATANVESAPIHLKEFEFFLPGFKLSVSPVLHVESEVQNGSLNANVIVEEDNDQKINITVHSENFAQFFNDSSEIRLKYDVQSDIQKIDVARWLGDPELNYVVNGKLKVKGEGTDPKTAIITLDGDFRDIIVQDKPVNKLLASLHLKNGDLSGKIEGEGNFGTLDITPEIRDLQGEPEYDLKLIARNFNLAEITGNDTLRSDINLTANIKGRNFEPGKIDVSADLRLSESRFNDLLVDTLVGEVQYSQKNIQVDSLWAETQTVSLNASGNYNLKGNSDLALKAKFSGLKEFEKFIPAEEIYAEGEIYARLKGVLDSLDVNAHLELKDARYNDLTTENLSVNANGKLAPGDTIIQAQIFAKNFRTGSLLVDTMDFDVNYLVDSVFVAGKVTGEDIHTSLSAGVRLGDSQTITLQSWQADYKNQYFDLQNPPAVIDLDSTQYKISNFKLASNETDSAQYIMADGVISRVGEENFQFKIANVNIQQLLEMFDMDIDAKGTMNIDAGINGTAEAPLITANFVVDSARFYEFGFNDFKGSFNLEDNKVNADVRIIPAEEGKFEFTGAFPMQAKLDSMQFKFDSSDPLNASLVVEQFPLAVLQNITILKEIKGYLEGNVEVKGTLESPDPEGNFYLTEASLEVPQYGINYEKIALNLDFLPEAVKLDSFFIKSDDGTMRASGAVDFSTAFYKGDVSQSKIEVEFHKFNPVDHRQFNMQLSGNANMQGKKGDVVFGGDLNVPEAELYLPAIFNMMGRMSEPDIPDPILVRELKNMERYTDSSAVQVDTVQTDTLNFNYFDNFTGTLNVEIPKNAWIKNKDMHIEISGDLEMRKNIDFFELFGSVDVVRGQYDLLGKTFIIDDGTINFQGGEELMPRIDITASYSFRNADRAEQKLTVQVTGTAEEPGVEFSLDGSSISEGDALAYILFGKSLDELSIDQQENVAGSGSLAGTAAAALLSSQLTNFLGEKLDVDYIEVKSQGGDFDNATVVVGKYITNDLFVSYEQRFGETDEKEMAKYEVKLEYELFKFLFLQLNNSSNDSGFDVIFKLNSE